MILLIGDHPAYVAVHGLLLRMGLTVATAYQHTDKYDAVIVCATTSTLAFPGHALQALQDQVCPILVLSTGNMFVSQASNRSNLKKESISENWLPTVPDSDEDLISLVTEKVVMAKHNCTVFRLFDAYGPHVSGLPQYWGRCIQENQEVLIPSPVQQTRCWLYIEDIEELLRKWFRKPVPGLFHVGSEFEESFIQVAEKLADVHQKSLIIREVPTPLNTWWRRPDTRKVAATYQWEATTSVSMGLLKCATMNS